MTLYEQENAPFRGTIFVVFGCSEKGAQNLLNLTRSAGSERKGMHRRGKLRKARSFNSGKHEFFL